MGAQGYSRVLMGTQALCTRWALLHTALVSTSDVADCGASIGSCGFSPSGCSSIATCSSGVSENARVQQGTREYTNAAGYSWYA